MVVVVVRDYLVDGVYSRKQYARGDKRRVGNAFSFCCFFLFLNKMDTCQNMKCRIDLMVHKHPKSHIFGALIRCFHTPQNEPRRPLSVITLSLSSPFSIPLFINHHVLASQINQIEVVLIFLFFSFFNLLFHPSLHQSHRRIALFRRRRRTLPPHYHRYRFSHFISPIASIIMLISVPFFNCYGVMSRLFEFACCFFQRMETLPREM